MSDEPTYRNITIRVDDLQISLQVARDEDSEEQMRNAAKRVNQLYSLYERAYPKASKRELLLYTSLHLAQILESGVMEHNHIETRLQGILKELDSVE